VKLGLRPEQTSRVADNCQRPVIITLTDRDQEVVLGVNIWVECPFTRAVINLVSVYMLSGETTYRWLPLAIPPVNGDIIPYDSRTIRFRTLEFVYITRAYPSTEIPRDIAL
jgi:hypothetical protein